MENLHDIANTVADSNPTFAKPPGTVPGRVVHIDGDMLSYLAGGNEDTTVSVSKLMLANKVLSIVTASGAEDFVIHLTTRGSLKGDRPLFSVTKPYQANRAKSSKPRNWEYLRDHLEQGHNGSYKIALWDDREADDGMAYAVTRKGKDGVIASGDKDMLATPGLHLDWTTLLMTEVPEGTYCMEHAKPDKCFGYKWFLLQMLHGDAVDNIPPLIRGYGPVRAAKALEGTTTAGEGMEVVIREFKGALDEAWAQRFVERALLLWIRRDREGHASNWHEHMPAIRPDDNALLLEELHRALKRRDDLVAEAESIMKGVPDGQSN